MVHSIARWFLLFITWLVSLLHFTGLVRPHKEVEQIDYKSGAGSLRNQAKRAAAATAQTAKASLHNPSVMAAAASSVREKVASVAKVRGVINKLVFLRYMCCAADASFKHQQT